ncbi:hypothetical protein, partial [Klebsiella pneumoniae]|uniref:hypothetical protein n=1 Tax=Klebsiella pneumoniae TaxID=573 RepID=UPI001D0D2A08
ELVRTFPNVPTGRMVKVIRTTGRSSDYLGPCEICSENMSESYAARYGRERLKENGVVYIDKSGGSTYGHKECLLAMVDVKPDTLALHLCCGKSKK